MFIEGVHCPRHCAPHVRWLSSSLGPEGTEAQKAGRGRRGQGLAEAGSGNPPSQGSRPARAWNPGCSPPLDTTGPTPDARSKGTGNRGNRARTLQWEWEEVERGDAPEQALGGQELEGHSGGTVSLPSPHRLSNPRLQGGQALVTKTRTPQRSVNSALHIGREGPPGRSSGSHGVRRWHRTLPPYSREGQEAAGEGHTGQPRADHPHGQDQLSHQHRGACGAPLWGWSLGHGVLEGKPEGPAQGLPQLLPGQSSPLPIPRAPYGPSKGPPSAGGRRAGQTEGPGGRVGTEKAEG